MADGFDRKTPKQESPDVKKLIEGDGGPPPPIGQAQDEHEKPDGPIGAVVKADYEVDPLDPDEKGFAEETTDPAKARTPSGRRAKEKPGDPAKLEDELAELRAKQATGQLRVADKGKLLDLEAEVERAKRPS